MLKRAIFVLSIAASGARAQASAASLRADSVATSPHYWSWLIAGAASSVLLHEAGHVTAAYGANAHPYFGFDTGRPTVYSGIDSHRFPRRQFWFSSAGLNAQAALNEAILDVPHHRGSAFERGLLAGGIGTAVFYLTIGRTGSVSDVDFIARTHVMNKTQITLLYGGVATVQAWRISRNPVYNHFFARPSVRGGLDVGLGF